MRRRAGGSVATALLVLAVLGSAEVTLARFRDREPSTATLSTATLQPPTDLTATGGTAVSLAWTPSSSGWAAGYEVLRSATSGSGYAQVGTVTPVTAAATADSPTAGTWFYVLRTTYHSWTSVRSNEATVTVGSTEPSTTPFADCASNAAETTNAGDNNGYEGSPASACALDGTVATDTGTGTSTTNSCSAATKDKHRFWGYALGLPPTVSSIDGITVSATVGMNNNGGVTWLCVQLSPDAGATWTDARSVTLSGTALATYTLGGAADRWGRASWSTTELDPANLRLRVIDSSSQPNKQLRLDAIRVAVTYTP